ncbi:Molybdopterin biosynthesis molybdochelatase MogA [Indibacter alkaliphilus LW1]|uniref:Molybdopterin adenylyltransferase n=1 Tax=Indibacter alkaliphilus (strain CCUG 57479 / KCTC 22604 / LW1) TaxID=1189612 RepID=S2E7X8_INDAL|nr:molybdopterin adenylyltransferase [Indibacter alkaliphilus]EOZ98388.1 Molybdopterin biosynthesis molybdochelatase MogA [Indibacter alkaliphilus LW1]
MEKIIIGILTCSDRAAANVYEDISGKEILDFLKDVLSNSIEPVYQVVPDEKEKIMATFRMMSDRKCALIVTTGGTGPAPRDVTPEATEEVCDKMLPGFGELMRQVSLQYVPTAILSRQTAGIYKQSLIVNLPGKPSAIRQCLEAVFSAIPYCLDLIGGPYLECDESKIKVFRPKS